jgi:hypothetical protein
MPDEIAFTDRVYAPSGTGGLEQGEILSDLKLLRPDPATLEGDVQLIVVEHAYAVILSQACDLERDWEYRSAIVAGTLGAKEAEQLGLQKGLHNVLLCPARPTAEVRPTLGNSELWRRIQKNTDERYQVIEGVPERDDAAGRGIPSLCFDFRHYVTVPTSELYQRLSRDAKRRSKLVTPYMEHLSHRFGHYLARIGLPRDHAPALPSPALPPGPSKVR